MNVAGRRLVVFGVAVPLAVLLAVVMLRKQPSVSEVEVRRSRILEKWNSLKFEEIEPRPAFLEKVRSIPMSTNCPVSETQRTNLYSSVYNALLGLHEGTYEAYKRFRAPTPAKLDPDFFNETNRQKLVDGAKPFMRPGEQVPGAFEEYVILMTSRMNEGRGLTNHWVGFCLTNASISIDDSRSLPADLLSVAGGRENLGLFRPRQFFVPDRGASDILSEHGKLLYATVSMVVSHTRPDPAFPVYIRFFWDDKYTCWVPYEFASSFSAKRKWALIW